ncbi:MAG: sugar ABC transporter permease [Spirochaetales bacterium]|nr:sugar ABC transporter permease [Spirochaetales bacterium]
MRNHMDQIPLRKLSLKSRIYHQRYLLFMALPALVWMIVFNYIPMYGIIIAFKRYRIIKSIADSPWVGLANFKELFTEGDFSMVMKNTLGIGFMRLFIGFPLPIIFALFLNEIKHAGFKRTIQTISYLPHFISWVVLGGIMMNWLSDAGLFNEILMKTGIIDEPRFFLAEPESFWNIAVFSDVWKELGWGAIIYLAAISGISPALYEAATVDGANRWQKMMHITMPSIMPTVSIMLILAISGILTTNFDQILVLRNAVNQSASDVIDIFVYRVGFKMNRFSYAQAISLFKSVVALILLLGANQISKKTQGHSLF